MCLAPFVESLLRETPMFLRRRILPHTYGAADSSSAVIFTGFGVRMTHGIVQGDVCRVL
jgi:hypothetical protein